MEIPVNKYDFVEHFKKQTINENYLIFNNGAPKNILFLGSCRVAPLMWYFNQLKNNNNRNIYGIYTVELIVNDILLTNVDKDKIKTILKDTDIIVCEKIKHIKGFNTDTFEENSFFHTFNIQNTLTLFIPNLYVKQFYYEMDNTERNNYNNVLSDSMTRFKRSCENSGYSELYDFFCKNNLKYRLFASSIHPTRITTLFLFKLLCKKIDITLPRKFFEENINFAFIDNQACPITKYDKKFSFRCKFLAKTCIIPVNTEWSLWDLDNPLDPKLYSEYVELLFRE